jgi:Fe-S-cluster-containing hydrogenase component 2
MRLSGQRRRIEQQFRDHSLDLVLRSTNLLKDLHDFNDIVSFIRNKIVFKRLIPGQAFTRQGAMGTDFFLVRLGYVKVSIATEGQEPRIISRGPGTTFGEISLLGLTPEELAFGEEEVNNRLAARLKKAAGDKFKSMTPGKQTATCSALDYLELATLDRPSFLEMLNQFPSVRQRLISQVFSRIHSDRELTPLLDEFTEQGLYEAQSVLVIDLDHCTRCDDCTRGCIKQHGTHSHGVPIPRLLRDGRRFANYMVATSCRSCVTPHCMEGCPVDAIHRGKHLQIVIEDHCIGCGLCADNCPYGSIFITENHHHAHAGLTAPKAATCDLCDAKGELTNPDPTCVAACPHDAAFRMSGDQLLATVLKNTRK